MADSTPKSYHTDPQLYLYTSLTSGSSQIVTATSRLQTILKANRIPFQALDVATDEKARMLWGRRAGKRKLPGLVRYGMILGDLEQIEEWNEYGEIKENLSDSKASAPASTPSASAVNTPSKPPPAPAPPPAAATAEDSSGPPTTSDSPSNKETPQSPATKSDPATSLADAMRQVGFEAAKKAGDAKAKARNDILEAAKSKSPDLEKLDHSGPTGMPPPTGSTTAEDAKKPDTGAANVESEADNVPPTSMEDPRAVEAEENAAANISPRSASKQDIPTITKEESQSDIPTAQEVQGEANVAIVNDEEEVLEGVGKAEVSPKDLKVPTAKELEEQANQAIVEDENSHVMFKGRGSVPRAYTPEYETRKEPKQPVSPSLAEEKANVTVTEEETKSEKGEHIEDEEGGDELDRSKSETAKRREAKVGVISHPADKTAGQLDLPDQSNTETKCGGEGPDDDNLGKDGRSEATTDPLTASDNGLQQVLPGSKTQEQPAAAGDKVGESVGD